MRISRIFVISAAVAALAMLSGAASAQTMKAAPQVQKALGTLNRVVDHTGRLITSKNYTRLPHENGEFVEGSEALEKSIADEPADFKAKIEPLLKKADANSKGLAEAAKAKDDAQLITQHAALVDSVKMLLAAFPASVQPPPPSVKQEKKEDAKEK